MTVAVTAALEMAVAIGIIGGVLVRGGCWSGDGGEPEGVMLAVVVEDGAKCC